MTELDTILTIEMIIIGAAAPMQKSLYGKIVATIFAMSLGMYVSLYTYFDWFSDWLFLGSALIDSLVIVLLSNLKKTPQIAVDIVFISVVSILLNCYGFVANGGDLYGSMFVLLYGWVIIKLSGGHGYAGNLKDDILISAFRFIDYSRDSMLPKG